MGADGLLGRVDVDNFGWCWWCGAAAAESFGVRRERGVEDVGAVGTDLVGAAVVDAGWGMEPDAKWRCSPLCQAKNSTQNARAWPTAAKRPGNWGRYFRRFGSRRRLGVGSVQLGRPM
jgi:hypothetical protein